MPARQPTSFQINTTTDFIECTQAFWLDGDLAMLLGCLLESLILSITGTWAH